MKPEASTDKTLVAALLHSGADHRFLWSAKLRPEHWLEAEGRRRKAIVCPTFPS
jgi:hypothetical protein